MRRAASLPTGGDKSANPLFNENGSFAVPVFRCPFHRHRLSKFLTVHSSLFSLGRRAYQRQRGAAATGLLLPRSPTSKNRISRARKDADPSCDHQKTHTISCRSVRCCLKCSNRSVRVIGFLPSMHVMFPSSCSFQSWIFVLLVVFPIEFRLHF